MVLHFYVLQILEMVLRVKDKPYLIVFDGILTLESVSSDINGCKNMAFLGAAQQCFKSSAEANARGGRNIHAVQSNLAIAEG